MEDHANYNSWSLPGNRKRRMRAYAVEFMCIFMVIGIFLSFWLIIDYNNTINCAIYTQMDEITTAETSWQIPAGDTCAKPPVE